MAYKTCENCGSKTYSGRCPNCDEETFILDQYYELQGTEFELPLPAQDSDFMKKVYESEKRIANNK